MAMVEDWYSQFGHTFTSSTPPTSGPSTQRFYSHVPCLMSPSPLAIAMSTYCLGCAGSGSKLNFFSFKRSKSERLSLLTSGRCFQLSVSHNSHHVTLSLNSQSPPTGRNHDTGVPTERGGEGGGVHHAVTRLHDTHGHPRCHHRRIRRLCPVGEACYQSQEPGRLMTALAETNPSSASSI